jgi:hypothetical protein
MIFRDLGFLVAPPPLIKLSLFLNLLVCRRSSYLHEKGERVGEEPNNASRVKLVLYKSFNTLSSTILLLTTV